MARAREIIAFTGLSGHENELAGSLPHGFRRILQVAIGLAPKPRLLLLDEPVAGMNYADVERMMSPGARVARPAGHHHRAGGT